MTKTIQAKHVSDVAVLRAVERLGAKIREAHGGFSAAWAFTWDLYAEFPSVPEKVMRAKMVALIRRKLVTGCTCGCRGDFEITSTGKEALAGEGRCRTSSSPT